MTSQSLPVEASSPTANLLTKALATTDSLSPTVLRLAAAVVMFPHGAQKVLGWFGGFGWDGTMGFLTGQVGLPGFVAGSVMLLEFFGPLLLLAGLGTRAMALGFVGIMLGAITTMHADNGFFMNWTGSQAGEGYEYHLLLIAMSVALVITGGGRWSLDARLASGNRAS